MKTKYFIYFLISVLITVFNVLPRLLNVWDTPNGNGMYLYLPLGFASWLLGPILSITFLISWIKEMRTAKNNNVLSATIPSVSASENLLPSSASPKSPIIRKSLLYTLVGIIAFLVILGSIVSKKEEVTTPSHSIESFMLVLPFIVFIGVALAIIWAVVYGIKAVSKK